jgi:hypothetical protein
VSDFTIDPTQREQIAAELAAELAAKRAQSNGQPQHDTAAAGTAPRKVTVVTKATAGAKRPGLLEGLRDGAWLDRQDFPPLAYAVPGIIPEGSVLLVGPPKIGKSWLVLAIALAAAAGGRALGLQVQQRPVLYLALEDGDRRLQDRCRRLLDREPIPEALHYLTRLEHGRVIDAVAAWLDQHPDPDTAPLVILDTLGKVMPPTLPGESAYQRDYRVGSALKQLADTRPGMTMLTSHHDRKADSGDFVDQVSGTNGLAGAADTIIVIARDRHESAGLLKVTGRDIPEGEYAVCFTHGATWALDGDTLAEAAQRARDARATAGLGDRAGEVIKYVGQHPDGVTPAQVAQALGLEPATARVYLRRVEEAGRLSRPHRGLYTPVTTVTSVTSAASPHTQVTKGPKGGTQAPKGTKREEGTPAQSNSSNGSNRGTRSGSNTGAEGKSERHRQLVQAIAFVAGNSPQDHDDAQRLATQAPDLAALIDPTADPPTPTPWGDEAPLAWALIELERRQAEGRTQGGA